MTIFKKSKSSSGSVPPSARPVIVHAEGNIVWAIGQDPSSRTWIAVCQPLNLNAAGETWIDLQQAIHEAMALLLRDLFETGELEAFLRAQGWQHSQLPPAGTPVDFDVPFTWQRKPVRELVPAH